VKDLLDLQYIVDKEISCIAYPKYPQLLYNPIEYIMGLKGKRIRPILVLMAHQLFDKDLDKAIPSAIAIEIFHNFTLLHDDIMDKAPLRRGNQTVHEKWNNNIAILSGDVMMIKAYTFLAKGDLSNLKDILDVFSSAAVLVCEGQQNDMNFETQHNVNLVDYMKMIKHKTAVLLAASLKIGAITAKANEVDQNHLYEFGINIGIAFQLKDDMLDVFGHPEKFGKQLGGDILSNKKTFLYLKALQLADAPTSKKLKELYANKETSISKVNAVKHIFINLNIKKHTINMMKAYYTKAIKHLDAVDSENKEPLVLFSNSLMDRVS